MWFPETEKVLNILSKEEKLNGFIFVGGSALSYYLNHRLSEDIDLFCTDNVLKQKRIAEIMKRLYDKGYSIKQLDVEDPTIQNDYKIDNTKVTFFSWSLDFLKTEVVPFKGNLKIANIDLLIGMKAYAFGRRMAFRDIYDLYVISKEIGFIKIIKNANRLFDGLFNQKIFIKQLQDLSYLEENKIEEYLKPKYNITKKDIEKYFIEEIEKYIVNEFKKIG